MRSSSPSFIRNILYQWLKGKDSSQLTKKTEVPNKQIAIFIFGKVDVESNLARRNHFLLLEGTLCEDDIMILTFFAQELAHISF